MYNVHIFMYKFNTVHSIHNYVGSWNDNNTSQNVSSNTNTHLNIVLGPAFFSQVGKNNVIKRLNGHE